MDIIIVIFIIIGIALFLAVVLSFVFWYDFERRRQRHLQRNRDIFLKKTNPSFGPIYDQSQKIIKLYDEFENEDNEETYLLSLQNENKYNDNKNFDIDDGIRLNSRIIDIEREIETEQNKLKQILLMKQFTKRDLENIHTSNPDIFNFINETIYKKGS